VLIIGDEDNDDQTEKFLVGSEEIDNQ